MTEMRLAAGSRGGDFKKRFTTEWILRKTDAPDPKERVSDMGKTEVEMKTNRDSNMMMMKSAGLVVGVGNEDLFRKRRDQAGCQLWPLDLSKDEQVISGINGSKKQNMRCGSIHVVDRSHGTEDVLLVI